MSKIQSAVDITLSKYPDIGKAELARLFMDYTETHLKDIVAGVELPSRVELKREWFIEKRKKKKFRMSGEELREREVFVRWLEGIKSEKMERPIDADFLIKMDGWSRDDVTILKEYPSASTEIEIGEEIYSKEFEEDLQPLGNHTLLEAIPKIERAVSIEKMREERLDEMIELISEISREISQNRVEGISHYYDDDFGFVVEIIVNQTDKEAFETWIRLIEEIKPLELGIIIAVDWRGENTLSENELVHKSVEVMLKSGVGPKRTDRFSAVEEIEERWM